MIKDVIGTQAIGLRLPFFHEGDGDKLINNIVLRYSMADPKDGDVIGITESIVARCYNFYVTLDEVGQWIKNFKPTAEVLVLYNPIFSRNRFVPILKGLLRADNIKQVIIVSPAVDEVGNYIEHQITGVNYRKLYEQIVKDSGKDFIWTINFNESTRQESVLGIDCRLHAKSTSMELTLQGICSGTSSWGLLGMNESNGERLKLFPDHSFAMGFVNKVKDEVKRRLHKDVHVMVYGDGAYKDPSSGIWEWADPVVSPAYTEGLDGSPCEVKLKAVLDSGKDDSDVIEEIRSNREKKGQQLGTTPRRIVDLLGSLMDLASGSGDKGTPVVIVRDYFKKYID